MWPRAGATNRRSERHPRCAVDPPEAPAWPVGGYNRHRPSTRGIRQPEGVARLTGLGAGQPTSPERDRLRGWMTPARRSRLRRRDRRRSRSWIRTGTSCWAGTRTGTRSGGPAPTTPSRSARSRSPTADPKRRSPPTSSSRGPPVPGRSPWRSGSRSSGRWRGRSQGSRSRPSTSGSTRTGRARSPASSSGRRSGSRPPIPIAVGAAFVYIVLWLDRRRAPGQV